jgi:hypothetical protein
MIDETLKHNKDLSTHLKGLSILSRWRNMQVRIEGLVQRVKVQFDQDKEWVFSLVGI